MARERIIEGRWSCGSCGAQDILGRHKSCPGCGNPREQGSETSFDFGAPTATGGSAAESVTDAGLLQLASMGPDWHCGYCESANRGDTAVCRNCGAEQVAAEPAPAAVPPLPVAAVAELPAAPAKPGSRRLLLGCVTALLASCGFCWWGSMTSEHDGRVAALSWKRRTARETFTRVEARGWRDELRAARAVMPVGGRGEVAGVEDIRGCTRKQRGTREVADGTKRVCTTRSRRVACGTEESCRVFDQGNGFGKEICDDVTKYCDESYEDCRDETRYRTEPVYGEECRYDTWTWREVEARELTGTTDPPRWHELQPGDLDRIVKAEDYRVEIRYDGDDTHVIETKNGSEFARWSPGAPVVLVVSNLGVVESVRPAP